MIKRSRSGLVMWSMSATFTVSQPMCPLCWCYSIACWMASMCDIHLVHVLALVLIPLWSFHSFLFLRMYCDTLWWACFHCLTVLVLSCAMIVLMTSMNRYSFWRQFLSAVTCSCELTSSVAKMLFISPIVLLVSRFTVQSNPLLPSGVCPSHC
jgi:hypothetical protein